MNKSTPTLNKPQDEIILYGKRYTAKELQDAVIDQSILHNRLSHLLD